MNVDCKYFKDRKSYIVMENPRSNLVVLIERHGDFPYFTYCFMDCVCLDGHIFGDIGAIAIKIIS